MALLAYLPFLTSSFVARSLLLFRMSARPSLQLFLWGWLQSLLAVVVEGCDGVVSLVEAYEFDIVVGVLDEREETALLLHEGLTDAVEPLLAGRVDCGALLGLHVQDHPV